jgi:hypothetical protein
MECPNCELENPTGSIRCDCGYIFLVEQATAITKTSSARENGTMRRASLLCLVIGLSALAAAAISLTAGPYLGINDNSIEIFFCIAMLVIAGLVSLLAAVLINLHSRVSIASAWLLMGLGMFAVAAMFLGRFVFEERLGHANLGVSIYGLMSPGLISLVFSCVCLLVGGVLYVGGKISRRRSRIEAKS